MRVDHLVKQHPVRVDRREVIDEKRRREGDK